MAQTISDTVAVVKADPRVDAPDVTVAEVKAEKLSDSLNKLKAEALGDALGDRLPESGCLP